MLCPQKFFNGQVLLSPACPSGSELCVQSQKPELTFNQLNVRAATLPQCRGLAWPGLAGRGKQLFIEMGRGWQLSEFFPNLNLFKQKLCSWHVNRDFIVNLESSSSNQSLFNNLLSVMVCLFSRFPVSLLCGYSSTLSVFLWWTRRTFTQNTQNMKTAPPFGKVNMQNLCRRIHFSFGPHKPYSLGSVCLSCELIGSLL